MGREEQIEEREVLSSIFPDEIVDLSDLSYRISIALDVPQEDDSDADAQPLLLLTVTYPEAYPDEPPVLDLSALHNAPKHAELDIGNDKAQLLAALGPTIEENLGMAMVFSLVSTLKDSAEQLIVERRAVKTAAKEAVAREAEAKENAKFHGEKVTRESFLRWRDGFVKEREEEERRLKEEKEAEEKRKRGKAEEVKMTGRQLWEKGLVGKVDEDDDDEEEGAAAEDELGKGVAGLKVGV